MGRGGGKKTGPHIVIHAQECGVSTASKGGWRGIKAAEGLILHMELGTDWRVEPVSYRAGDQRPLEVFAEVG